MDNVKISSVSSRNGTRRSTSRLAETADENTPTIWLLIFSDLTTILLTFFVLRLALTIPQSDLSNVMQQSISEADPGLTEAKNLESTGIPLNMDEPGLTISRGLDDEILILISSEIFGEGSAELSFQSGEAIRALLGRISEQLAQRGRTISTVEVRGHSDGQAINSKQFPSNWELSIARAIRVMRQLVDSGVSAQMISAAGYGDSRPIGSNQISVSRHLNRRAEIVIKSTRTVVNNWGVGNSTSVGL